MNGPALVRRAAPVPVRRPALTGGTLPERQGPEADHARLVHERDTAVRVYLRWHDHDAEIDLARAQDRLDAFEREHPGFTNQYPKLNG